MLAEVTSQSPSQRHLACRSEGVSSMNFTIVIASEAKQSSWAVLEGTSFANARLDCFASLAMTVTQVTPCFISVIHGAAPPAWHETGAAV
jgi:hypothetical protein